MSMSARSISRSTLTGRLGDGSVRHAELLSTVPSDSLAGPQGAVPGRLGWDVIHSVHVETDVEPGAVSLLPFLFDRRDL